MVDIQSKEVIDKISDELKIQPALQIPRELSKNIQLSYDVNSPKKIKIAEAVASDTTSAAIFTTSTTKRTFVIGGGISVSKSALSDSTNSRIVLTPIGDVTGSPVRIRYEPTTAASNLHQEFMLPFPIEVDKGSAISITNSAATASIDTQGQVFYYETDPQ